MASNAPPLSASVATPDRGTGPESQESGTGPGHATAVPCGRGTQRQAPDVTSGLGYSHRLTIRRRQHALRHSRVRRGHGRSGQRSTCGSMSSGRLWCLKGREVCCGSYSRGKVSQWVTHFLYWRVTMKRFIIICMMPGHDNNAPISQFVWSHRRFIGYAFLISGLVILIGV